MNTNKNYQPKDYIIDFVNIYQITSISFDDKDKKNKRIHYQPIKTNNQNLTASIPEENLTKAGFRRLLNTAEINQLLVDFKKEKLTDYQFDIRQIKEEVYLNIPQKMLSHIKYLATKGDTVTKEEQLLHEKITNHLYTEISFVTKKTILEIKKEFKSTIKKSPKIED